MRYFHKQQNHFWKPVINLDKVILPSLPSVRHELSMHHNRTRDQLLRYFKMKSRTPPQTKEHPRIEFERFDDNRDQKEHRADHISPLSCGLLSPPRPAMPTSPDPRRTPSPSSTSSPSATPRFSARAVSPKSPWLFAQDGSASWPRRRSRRLVVLLSWLRKYAQQLKRRRFFLSVL